MTRYCPNCRAVVPENSLNCPQCFAEIPRDGFISDREQMGYTPSRDEYEENLEKRHKSSVVVLLLAIIPAFFGILGMGQIYRDRRDKVGWYFFVGGLILVMLAATLLTVGFAGGLLGTIILAIPAVICIVVYVLAAIVSVVDAMTGSLIRFGLKGHL